MKRTIAITGGKGGTGKSTVACSLAYELSKKSKVMLVDADVDCPNDHLILGIERQKLRDVLQRIPQFDMLKCSQCSKCGRVCMTKAIVSVKSKYPIFIEEQCNGCGSCRIICPQKAISWSNKKIGELHTGKKAGLSLLSGELKPGQPVSEFIVNQLNKEIKEQKDNYDYIIIDTAAGSHCPVIAAFETAGRIIAVTEPTPLGAHDLEIILNLLKQLGKKCTVIINRSDIGDKKAITELASGLNSRIILEIPYSEEILKSYSSGSPIKIPRISEAIEK